MSIPREERKNAVGIAMSGGGLQGIAHVGAIRALYELGIRPQFISGTSSGSALAAITAMGYEPDEMEEFAKKHWKTLANFDKGPVFKSIARFILQKKKSKSDGLRPGEMISDLILEAMAPKGIKGFSDLITLSISLSWVLGNLRSGLSPDLYWLPSSPSSPSSVSLRPITRITRSDLFITASASASL